MSPSFRATLSAAAPSRGRSSPAVGICGREPPATRVTLLTRLTADPDADAWREFVRLYGPVVYGFARNRGLQDADAADVMQEVLRSVARSLGAMAYDPARGTFRGWLYKITRNKIFDYQAGRHNRLRGSGDWAARERLESVPDPSADPEGAWELEYRRRLSARAMGHIESEFRATTWRAFWGAAVEGRPAPVVGAELGMTPGAVHVAKSRVLARLRDEVRRLQAEEEGR